MRIGHFLTEVKALKGKIRISVCFLNPTVRFPDRPWKGYKMSGATSLFLIYILTVALKTQMPQHLGSVHGQW